MTSAADRHTNEASVPLSVAIEWFAEPTLLLSEEGQLVQCNRAFATLLGRSAAELHGRSLHRIATDVDSALIRELDSAVSEFLMSKLSSFRVDLEPGTGGSRSVFAVEGRIVPKGHGANDLIVHMKEVTSERLLKEEAVRLRQRLTSIIEQLQDHAIVVVDRRGIVSEWNPSAERLLGYTEVEALGEHIEKFLPPRTTLNAPGETFVEQVSPTQALRIEGSIIRKDGVTLWVQVTVTSLFDQDLRQQGCLVVIHDQTEQRHVEDSLHQRANDMETLLNTLPIGVFVALDPECRQIIGNPAARQLLRTTQRNLSKSAPDDERPGHFRVLENGVELQPHELPVQRAARGEYLRDIEIDDVFDDGTVLHTLISAAPLHDAHGAIRGAVATVLDVTERKRAENELAAQRNRELSYLEHLPIGVWFINAEGRMEYGNRTGQQIWGGSRYVHVDQLGEYVGWWHATGKQVEPHEWGGVRAIRDGQTSLNEEIDILCFDGARKTILNSAVPVKTATGEILGAVVLNQDITDRKRAEQSLAEAHQFINASLDALSSHIAVLDEQGVILAVNEAWRQFAHDNQHQGLAFEVGANYLDACRPDAECMEPEIPQGLKGVLTGELSSFEYEYPCHSPTERRWFVMRVTRFKRPGPVRVVVAHENITARKHAEDLLRASETRFRQLADAMPQVVWIANAQGEVVYYNSRAEQFMGIKQTEDGLWVWQPAMHPEDLEKTVVAWQTAVAQRTLYQCEHRLRMTDGSYRWQLSRAIPMTTVEGEQFLWYGTATDIDELKAAQEALREADRRKDEFLATLAHELRNPLAPLRNGLEVLRLAKDDATALEQCHEMMGRQLSHMVRLIDDLLDLSRISRGKIELRKERLELAKAIQHAVETSRPLIENSGHRLTVNFTPNPIYVDADPTRLAQIFSNLLNNAAKYTEPHGRIILNVDQEGDWALVSVQDSGVGIPEHMLPRVFDMFTQVDQSLERSQGGLGIGLS